MAPRTYTHGHHESVLRSHRWRTAENSAAYLLGSLRPGMALLDVGCGPGTITAELAGRVAPGRAVGVDAAPDVLGEARATDRRSGSASATTFVAADASVLPFADESFDVVHAHQLLQHLADPVGALREMRRVLRPGGRLAVRDSDYGAFVWWPPSPLLERWLTLYHEVTARNGAQADAGRRLAAWVEDAGFDDVEAGSSTWTFATAEDRLWWGELWAQRVTESAFASQAVAYGLTGSDELAAVAEAWRAWAASPRGLFVVVHGEVLARR